MVSLELVHIRLKIARENSAPILWSVNIGIVLQVREIHIAYQHLDFFLLDHIYKHV